MTTPVHNIPVYLAEDFPVSWGANLGDPLSHADELELDDIYTLAGDAARHRLAIAAQGDGSFEVAAGSEVGREAAPLHLDCTISLMSPDGQTTDALVLVELDPEGHVAQTYLLPLAPLVPGAPLTLVGTDRDSARRKFAQIACVSFTRGTHITLASGEQRRIEELRVGDRVLTRDDGVQQVRRIGQNTVRASGAFAPIVIRAGILNNAHDLVVSPDHRLFVYQRTDRIGAGRAELLVKARHLVNGTSVYVQEGGFVDYFQILFDRHHIIYAEGIAAESMFVDTRTRPALPEDLVQRLKDILPEHSGRFEHGVDVQKALLDRPDAIDLLRLASSR